MLRVVSAAPPDLAGTSQGDFTGRLVIPLCVPLFRQVWPPNRQQWMARCPSLCITTCRTAGVGCVSAATGSHVWLVPLQTHPQELLVAVLSHLGGWWVVGVPLLGQPGVCSHRLALAETAALALTIRADYVDFCPSQIMCPGIPLMPSSTPMPAAWALQRDPLGARVSEVCRLLALVAGGVPHALDGGIVRMCQCLLAGWTCIFADCLKGQCGFTNVVNPSCFDLQT